MKRLVGVVLAILVCFSFLQSTHVGKSYIRAVVSRQPERLSRLREPAGASPVHQSSGLRDVTISRGGNRPAQNPPLYSNAYFTREILRGNLKLKRVQKDTLGGMEHRRYTQYYQGLEVLGGQIIQHIKRGVVSSTTGEHYEISGFDTTPYFTKDVVTDLFRTYLARASVTSKEEPRLIIYPIKDGDYRLAYRVILNDGPGYSMTGIIDAKNAEIIREYSNINYDDLTIGLGIGFHGEQLKLPTTYESGKYWLADLKKARPVNQATLDFMTFDGNAWYIASDADNMWDSDGALVSAHAFLGWTYDYYFSAMGRNGIDDNNLDIVANVHFPTLTDNALWDGNYQQIFIFDPGPFNLQMAAGLDLVAHEYSHGVTQFTSGLLYYCDTTAQPGALNESFSDIMGTAVEFGKEESGSGFDKADWKIGEDAYSYYSPNNYVRSLSNPNSVYDQIMGNSYPEPCHLSQCIIFPNTQEGDSGGVHFNSTLYSHAFYLLAAGGTNSVSGLSVTGIGIDNATKIFYRAWTYYLTPVSSFLDAGNALLQSAFDLFGSNSNEYAQAVKSMEAIGWIVN